MRADVEKGAQPRCSLRDGVGARDADGVEAVVAGGLRELGLQRRRRQKSRSA
jgi:hypothetical protein